MCRRSLPVREPGICVWCGHQIQESWSMWEPRWRNRLSFTKPQGLVIWPPSIVMFSYNLLHSTLKMTRLLQQGFDVSPNHAIDSSVRGLWEVWQWLQVPVESSYQISFHKVNTRHSQITEIILLLHLLTIFFINRSPQNSFHSIQNHDDWWNWTTTAFLERLYDSAICHDKRVENEVHF